MLRSMYPSKTVFICPISRVVGNYWTSPTECGYVDAVDGGYMLTCIILGEAEITYDEYRISHLPKLFQHTASFARMGSQLL